MEDESYLYIEARPRSVSPEAAQEDYLEQFIMTYKSLPSLWDRTNPNYLNKRKRNEDLDKLTRILRYLKTGATREDTRKKVNSLRSNFRKELVKIENSKKSGGEVYKPRSSSFHMLKFLANMKNPLLLEGESDEDAEDKKDSSIVYSVEKENPPPKTKKLSYYNGAPTQSEDWPRKIMKRSRIENRNRLMAKHCILPRPPQHEVAQTSVEPIVLVWSEKIKNLSMTQRLHVEKAINDIIYEAEVKNLEQNVSESVTPLTTTYDVTLLPPPLPDKNKSDTVISKVESFECDNNITERDPFQE